MQEPKLKKNKNEASKNNKDDKKRVCVHIGKVNSVYGRTENGGMNNENEDMFVFEPKPGRSRESLNPSDASWYRKGSISKTLKKIRVDLGLRQKDLARMIRVSHMIFWAIENERRLPSDNILKRLYSVISKFDADNGKLFLKAATEFRVSKFLHLYERNGAQIPDLIRETIYNLLVGCDQFYVMGDEEKERSERALRDIISLFEF